MPDRPGRIRFVADRGDARLRLDQALVRRAGEVSRMSRARAQAWIDAGAVLVDGVQALRASARLREGAVVEIDLPESAARRPRPEPEELSIEVVYEDEHLLAVDKPAGQVVHPSYRNTAGTVLNAVLWRLRDRPGLRPGIVSRLDKGTSGVLIVALGPEVHAALQRDAAAGRMRKEYLAVVRGTPKPRCGEIDLPLARDAADRRRVVVDERGAHSLTRYEVLSTAGGRSLVRCELVTGRTHQIRVHLAARGWPIAGDVGYGGEPGPGRPALHAWRVTFTHPVSGATMTITAPVPTDIRRLLPEKGSGTIFRQS
jgi:23S rRNA pseudouridine1911/1915/1917 synthase